jgi:hypothetical protein
MNRVPRPTQVTEPRRYYARLAWPAILGGESEVIGPYANPRERARAIAAARAPYPGHSQPSARLYDLPMT